MGQHRGSHFGGRPRAAASNGQTLPYDRTQYRDANGVYHELVHKRPRRRGRGGASSTTRRGVILPPGTDVQVTA